MGFLPVGTTTRFFVRVALVGGIASSGGCNENPSLLEGGQDAFESTWPVVSVPPDGSGTEAFEVSGCRAILPNSRALAVEGAVESDGTVVRFREEALPYDYGAVSALHEGARINAPNTRPSTRDHLMQLTCSDSTCGSGPPTESIVGRFTFGDDPRCGVIYQIGTGPTLNLTFEIQGQGRAHFEGGLNPTTSCSATTPECVLRVGAEGRLDAELETLALAPPPEFRAGDSADCELVGSLGATDNPNRYRATFATGGSNGLCRIAFPEPPRAANVGIEVAAGASLRYGLAGDDVTYPCGDDAAEATCGIAAPVGAALDFTADVVEGGEPVWSGDCRAVPGNPWVAAIDSAQTGQRCRLALTLGDGCEPRTPPEIRLYYQGMAISPVDEGTYTVVVRDGDSTVTLSTDPAGTRGATYTWQVSDENGVFNDIGSTPTIRHRLQCPSDSSCGLRVIVTDACGPRETLTSFSLSEA